MKISFLFVFTNWRRAVQNLRFGNKRANLTCPHPTKGGFLLKKQTNKTKLNLGIKLSPRSSVILAAPWHPLPSQGQTWKADGWLEFDCDVELRLMERKQLRPRLEMGHGTTGADVQTGTVERGWSRLRLSRRLRAGGAAALGPCALPSSPSPGG